MGNSFADIAPVISWAVDSTTQNPYPLTLRRGETVILQPTYNQDLTGTDTVVLKTRASGAPLPTCVTGSVYSATGGVARIRFDVTLANGIYQYEVALISSNAANLRGNGTLTVVDSMAGEIATTPPSGTGDTLAPSEPEGSYPNDIAPVISWETTPGQLTAKNHTLNQGETVILRPKLQGYDLSGAAAVALRYRPTGASGWHYVAPGTVHNATNGEIQVRWDSSIEGSNTTYQYEIALQSPSAFVLGAIGTITRRPSLSGSSTSMPTRVTAFDWATVDHQNIGSAPFLSTVALAPFASFWASLTNGTADLNVHSLLIDGVPVGTGGVMNARGTYTNTMINGISHTGAVSIVAGSNTTWRLVNGSWRVDVPTIAGERGPAGTNGVPGTNVIVYVGAEKGDPGTNGYTPIKGVDYFDGSNGTNGTNGTNGYSPIKGIDYFDGSIGPTGATGAAGVAVTNITYSTNLVLVQDFSTNIDLSVTTNLNINVITNLNIGGTNISISTLTITNLTIQDITSNIVYNAVDDSKWPTNQPFVSAMVWTNAGANFSTTNAGLITTTINTNSGSGGVSAHSNLTAILGNGAIHLNEAETNRIPPALTTTLSNVTYALSATATNAPWWRPVYQNGAGGLSTYWNYSTNFLSSGNVTQTWVVPVGVQEIFIKAWGGGGGGGALALAGAGGFASSIVKVSAGDTVQVCVANGGPGWKSGFYSFAESNWFGGGSPGTNTSPAVGASGGGASIILHNDTVVLVAAGGGGGGGGQGSYIGGIGGASVGQTAAGGGGGTGGSQVIGGTGYLGGFNGDYLQGGSGSHYTGTNTTYKSGAGGGGGYYGGGGGNYGIYNSVGHAMAAGGGSCWARPDDGSGILIRGNNTTDLDWFGTIGNAGAANGSSPGGNGGNGYVKLYWYFPGQ